MNCFFSLIIASKNEEKDIYLSLDSSLKQKYKNYEIIVIDDSTDGTKNIIRDYQKRFDNLFLLRVKALDVVMQEIKVSMPLRVILYF